jgi:hypothetical protein
MDRRDLITQRTKKGRGYAARKRVYLQDNAVTVELIGEFVSLRDESSVPTTVATLRANEALLFARWVQANQEELTELAGGVPPSFWQAKSEAEIAQLETEEKPDPESFAGLLSQLGQEAQQASDNMRKQEHDIKHPLNPLIKTWLQQLHIFTNRNKSTW